MIRDCLEPEKHVMFPKNPRVKNKKLLNEIRAIGYCDLCGSPNSLEVHHIKSKGSGGDDVRENLICLCALCHRSAHDGRVDKDRLKEIVRRREEHGS